MIGAIRLIVYGFLALSVVYVAVSIYSRSVRREKLEEEWAETHPDEIDSPARSTFIEDGMKAYQNGLRRKLILLVYIIPAIAIAVTMYLINAT